MQREQNNSLIEGDRQIQETITGLHEGGHLYIHPSQFTHAEGQLYVNDYDEAICCRKSDIDKIHSDLNYQNNSSEMWREWQANVFAVTLALSKKSLDISVNELFQKYDIKEGQLIVDADNENQQLAYKQMSVFDFMK